MKTLLLILAGLVAGAVIGITAFAYWLGHKMWSRM